MNRFELIGRLTKDPETRYMEDGKEITTFTLAVDNMNNTSFIKINTFGNTSSLIKQYIKKGNQIYVEGLIKNNDYTDKKGIKHFEYTFVGNRVEFLSNKGNYIPKEESAKKGLKNELDDSVFAEFGNKIEIEESELAF